jgi:hypothetical protein
MYQSCPELSPDTPPSKWNFSSTIAVAPLAAPVKAVDNPPIPEPIQTMSYSSSQLISVPKPVTFRIFYIFDNKYSSRFNDQDGYTQLRWNWRFGFSWVKVIGLYNILGVLLDSIHGSNRQLSPSCSETYPKAFFKIVPLVEVL